MGNAFGSWPSPQDGTLDRPRAGAFSPIAAPRTRDQTLVTGNAVEAVDGDPVLAAFFEDPGLSGYPSTCRW